MKPTAKKMELCLKMMIYVEEYLKYNFIFICIICDVLKLLKCNGVSKQLIINLLLKFEP